MSFLQITVDVGDSGPAPFEEALLELGAVSITLEDAADDPVLEPAPGETPMWPTVLLKALFDGDADTAVITSAIVRRFPGMPIPQVTRIEDRAWEREWLKDFRPMRFGRRLWVCPGGQPAGDVDAVRVELDPGLAFGTGTHPTTAMCLEWLDSRDLHGRELVDYGCGSGILAIAALKLGASSARAVDIDAQALVATRQNAERNCVGSRLTVSDERALARASADILVANILAGPLVELAPEFAAAVRSNGEIAVSGVLVEQVDAVTSAYRPWFDTAFTGTREGWGLIGGRRRVD